MFKLFRTNFSEFSDVNKLSKLTFKCMGRLSQQRWSIPNAWTTQTDLGINLYVAHEAAL